MKNTEWTVRQFVSDLPVGFISTPAYGVLSRIVAIKRNSYGTFEVTYRIIGQPNQD